ncbi:MAG TPA: translation initiation factor IF-3 [Thermosynergistes sp.]|nr:translation initiation factor IF-3 [Synergistaceae bacterium]HOA76172.1 translation initiation factor IF-3 [Thermosynergistes sp.]HHV52511.1 translation initiation factor IF-3 [Synergistaceae bacterium]HOK19108.1 translation initiation factor IF-3 [Thermosynergistes sp.]HPP38149.1 translation initiation factor IF-3 [Thermosynergistes sp.]
MTTSTEEPRVNREIWAAQVLVIDDEGKKLGVMTVPEALRIAEERGLDLVEVAPLADPPVCRIMDYGKYKYKLQKRDKEARKKQKVQSLKEMKMRPKIDEHDYNFKTRKIREFLADGHRVRVSVFFRGREMSFLDKGRELLERVARDCSDIGRMDAGPIMEGRYMRMTLMPLPQKGKEKREEAPKAKEEALE